MADRGADRSRLARGVPDLDQGGRNGLRASAAPRGLRALALRLRHFRRKPSPAVCPCAPSGSSSSYGKRGSIRLRKSWPRQRRQQRQPKLELASRRASRPRSQFRPEILPIRNRPTRNPRRPRNPIRGKTRNSKLRDRKNVRHEGKVRRATVARDLALPQARQLDYDCSRIFVATAAGQPRPAGYSRQRDPRSVVKKASRCQNRSSPSWPCGVIPPDSPFHRPGCVLWVPFFRVGDDLVDICRRSWAKAKSSARPSDRRHLTKLGARRTWVFLPGVTC